MPVGVFVFLGLLYFIWPAYRDFLRNALTKLSSGEREEIQRWIAGYGAWGTLVIFGLMILQTLVPFLPSLVTMVVAVLAYGPLVGGAFAWGGLLLAACAGYGIGLLVGPVTVDRLIGGKAKRQMEHFVDRYGSWGIVAARVSPALSTDAVSIVAGLVKMSFTRFGVATAVGTLPLTIAVAWLGEDIARLQCGLIWISVISLLIFVGYVYWDHKNRST